MAASSAWATSYFACSHRKGRYTLNLKETDMPSDSVLIQMAISAIASFNSSQGSTLDMIDAYPSHMKVVSPDVVVLDSPLEHVMVARRNGGVFEVIGRQVKVPLR